MTRDQEIWAMALWVEEHHGADGPQFIASQIDRLANDSNGQVVWRKVEARFAESASRSCPNLRPAGNVAALVFFTRRLEAP